MNIAHIFLLGYALGMVLTLVFFYANGKGRPRL